MTKTENTILANGIGLAGELIDADRINTGWPTPLNFMFYQEAHNYFYDYCAANKLNAAKILGDELDRRHPR